MKWLLLVLVSSALAWNAFARQDPVVRDVRTIVDMRTGVARVEARGDNDKWSYVTFEPPLLGAPIVTATVCDTKPEGEYSGVFAVITKDIGTKGFRFRVQEADSKLQWSEDLQLHWTAVVQE